MYVDLFLVLDGSWENSFFSIPLSLDIYFIYVAFYGVIWFNWPHRKTPFGVLVKTNHCVNECVILILVCIMEKEGFEALYCLLEYLIDKFFYKTKRTKQNKKMVHMQNCSQKYNAKKCILDQMFKNSTIDSPTLTQSIIKCQIYSC